MNPCTTHPLPPPHEGVKDETLAKGAEGEDPPLEEGKDGTRQAAPPYMGGLAVEQRAYAEKLYKSHRPETQVFV